MTTAVEPRMKLYTRCHTEAANNMTISRTEVEQSDFEIKTVICLLRRHQEALLFKITSTKNLNDAQ